MQVQKFPDDVYRNELRSVIAALTAWANRHRDVATIDVRDGGGFWSLSARPQTRGASPFALVLRADQKFDIALAGERFDDLEVDDFAAFAAIANAVSDGRIETRDTFCAVTGAARTRMTRVLFGDGSSWERQRRLGSAHGQATLRAPDDSETERVTRALPYRR